MVSHVSIVTVNTAAQHPSTVSVSVSILSFCSRSGSAFFARLHSKVGVIYFFPPLLCFLVTLCPVYNKVHSAVAVCKANTDLNHFSILITSAAETITPAFALSSLFASVPSPKPIYPLSAAIRYRRLPICTSSCFVIIFPLITHPTHILYLCLSLLLLSFFFPPPPAPIPVLIWVWPGHVCSVSCALRPI